MSEEIYNHSVQTINGEKLSLEKFKGKVLLIVNTASKCGFTPQYNGMEKLHKKYQQQGLELLAFPCNQFGGQEPGTEKEIQEFCQINYHLTFPLYSKIEVNGDNAHPLYQYLKNALPGLMGSKAIKWNFTKFIVDRFGKPFKRYAPNTTPDELSQDIEQLLNRE